jgi:uracil permease
MIAPALLVVLAEHVSHLVVTGNIAGRGLVKNPALHQSLFGDGISNVLSGLAGATQPHPRRWQTQAGRLVTTVWQFGACCCDPVLRSLTMRPRAVWRAVRAPIAFGDLVST